MDDSDLRIVLLGKTGAGKSSLCNTIFGEDLFKINHWPNTETGKCQKATRSVNGKRITVIDTPGLFDTDRSEEELKSEIVKCITECSPGPHAFLILLKVEEYTGEEQEVITKICQYFPEEAFKYAVVVFTHGDQLPEGMKIEEFVSENETLSELVRKCGGRCHVIDNKYWKNNWFKRYRKNKLHVKALLNTIEAIVDKGGYYTNEMLQAVERKIQHEEESIRKSSPDSDLRIVLVGKTGAGKSSLCNTIFGEDLFKINHCANSETAKCQTAIRSVNGKKITVIDTPCFFDTNRSEEELKPEIVKCITECSPGPHAFLILLKVEKYTDQEQEVIDKICEYFSEEALKYAVVVFTHGDQLPEGMKIEEFFSQNKKLSELVRKCGGRCHVFDNKYWKNNQQDEYRSNQFQVTELLNTIKVMVDKGHYYTNEVLQEVERKIQQEEESIRKSSPGMSEEEIREKAKRNVSNLLKKIVSVTTGVLLGALLGVTLMIVSVVAAIKGRVVGAVVAEAAAGDAAAEVGLAACAGVTVAGAVLGGCIGSTEADQEGSVKEAAENRAQAVFDKAKNMINSKKQKQSEEKSHLL